MIVKVLTTTPDDWGDLACHYGTVWTRTYLIPFIKTQGFDIFDLQNTHCNKAEFDAETAKHYSFFKGFGHGNATKFAGYQNKILLDVAAGPTAFTAFSETMVHLLSCSTGASLGKMFPVTYMGYKDVYYFMAQVTGPVETDPLARPYFDSDFEYDRQILSGKTHGDAVAACKAKYKEWYDKSDVYARQYLLYDAGIIQPYGDPAKTHPAAPPPFDFSVKVTPTSISVEQGKSATAKVDVTLLTGEPKTVRLFLLNVPDNCGAKYEPMDGYPTFSSTLTVVVGSTTPAGTYTLKVRGTNWDYNITRETTLTLTVTEAEKCKCPWGDFEGTTEEVQKHILDVHCPKCPVLPDACSAFTGSCPKWLRSWLGCKIP